jgi:tetratricopeptide (TPR) repeat protein
MLFLTVNAGQLGAVLPAPAYVSVADPVAELRARAEREMTTPDAATRRLPPPPGIDAKAVGELAENERSATSPGGMSLATVLSAIATKGPPPSFAAIKAAEPDPEAEAEAAKLYSTGRMLRADGKNAEALAALQEASKVDPASAAVWREIAECQNSLGRRAASQSAMQQAVRRGLRDAGAWSFLGREATRGLRSDEALWLLAGAAGMMPGGSAESAVNDLNLAEAMDRAGYTGAAGELLARGLGSKALSPESARSNPEIAETLRRRGELWQRAGDLAMRLGRVEEASSCYEAAAKESSSDAGALAVRRVYAAVRSGRPAQAAIALVDKLRAGGGFEDRELGVVRYLADKTDVGPALSAAIVQTLGDRATNASATSRLARARAAALPIALRRTSLIDHLSANPSDRKAASDLLGSFAADQLSERDRAIAMLVEKRPESADVYAALLLAEGKGVVAAANSLARGEPAATLLAAYLKLALGKPAEGLSMLKPERFPGMLAAMLAARADLAGLAGDYDSAKAALTALEALPIESTRFARARALSALQRYSEAMEVVRPLVDSASADDRLLVAGFALRSGDLSLGEKILAAVAEEDPQDERAAEVLLRLYSRGEKADQRQLSSLVQRLREKVSSSRVLRWATAMELVQRGQFAAAEQSLMGLAEEDASGPGLLDALALVWTRGGVVSLERGEAWLRARLDSAPESTETLAALAQVVSARGRTEEAIGMLNARIAIAPIERHRRLVELLTADPLAKPAEARELTIARLTPTPRTIDSAIVLADTLVTAGRAAEVDSVLASLPDGVPLTPDQKKGLSAVVASLIDADMDAVIAGKPTGAASAMAKLAALGIEPGPAVRESGIVLLTLTQPPDLARIGEEFLAFTQGDDDKERLAMGRLIQKLLASKKPAAILVLAEAVCAAKSAKGSEPDDDMLRVLCVSIGQFGDGTDLRRILPLVTKGSRAERILDSMSLDAEPAPAPPKQPGMLAYRIAGIASNHERYEQAASLYEVSLELDPDHAIALNDFGYMLLEHQPVSTQERRTKIEGLLEKAYQSNPTSYNIVDSLGWLRYLQGRFEDDANKGAIAGAGALSLLRRAVELQQREQDLSLDPFIIDHLGDALWASGDKDKALACWQQAESKATTLSRARADNLAEDGYGKLLKKTLESASAKRQAAKNGKEPAIAPRWEPLKP